MPRIRTVKPEFFQHEDLSSLDADIHLFALGLVCYADDEGYFNANPGLVKGIMFPLRGHPKSIGAMLEELAKIGYLRLGVGPDGKKYGHIIHFTSHQVINRPTDSKIKNLAISWSTHVPLTEDSVSTHGGLTREGKGKEWERKGSTNPAPDGGSVFEFAKGIIEQLQMPLTKFFLESVEASIIAKMKTGMSDEQAASFIVQKGLEYKARGNMPNKNWFEAAGYDKPAEKVKAKPEVPLYITERHKLEALGVKIEQGVPPSKYRDMLKAKGASNGNS